MHLTAQADDRHPGARPVLWPHNPMAMHRRVQYPDSGYPATIFSE
eukprot:SAG31_NODE_32949_length_349_cov_35.692000_1_plen_44_part_10